MQNPSPVPQTPEEWEKKCKESDGSMIMLPEPLLELAVTHKKAFDEMEAKRMEFVKANYYWNKENTEFWHKVREALAMSGHEDIWDKDMGWNQFAEEQGVKVINILAANGR